MAARADWKGTIALGGGLVPVSVEAIKGSEKYAGDEPLKELCACHQKPLDRSHRCATTKEPPAGKVKAVLKPDDTYAILTDAQVEGIKAGIQSGEVEPLALLPRDAWASHTINELWYLRPNRKEVAAIQAVNLLYAVLARADEALIARVIKDGRQHIVAIHAADGKLIANRLRYAQEIKEPEQDVLAVGKAQVEDKGVQMLGELLAELPTGFNIAEVEDVTVARKQAAIQAALSGSTAVATTEAAPSAVPDLMAALSQAVADKKSKKPAKRASAKEKVST